MHRVDNPTVVGCSYETLLRMVSTGAVTRDSILRGPSTRQLWQVARRVPGIAHLVGNCHQCRAKVERRAGAQLPHCCAACGVSFGAYLDRNWYGLPDINPLPDDPSLDPADRMTPRGMTPTRSASLSTFVTDDELLVPEVCSDAPRNASEALARTARTQPMGIVSGKSAFTREGHDSVDGSSAELLTVMERTLLDRAARLERTNRILLATTLVCFVISLALLVQFTMALRDWLTPVSVPAAARAE